MLEEMDLDDTRSSALRALRRRLPATVHGELGLVQGEIIEISRDEIRFWCREELVPGARHDVRIDLGVQTGNADIVVVVQVQQGRVLSGSAFLHLARWTETRPQARRQVADAVRLQLPDLDLAPPTAAVPPPQAPARPAPPPVSPPRASGIPGVRVQLAHGPSPAVAVELDDERALISALRIRQGRAVLRIGDRDDLEPDELLLLILRLPDRTYHQVQAQVVRGKGSLFLRSSTLTATTRLHIEQLLDSAGITPPPRPR